MPRKNKKTPAFKKIVDERYVLPKKRGGGTIKIEAWEDNKGQLVKYNIAYINHDLYQGDNGRVIGYDNAHDYHHKHEFGEISPVEDFSSYEDILERFEAAIEEYIQ